jgi:hypothetical protein
MFHTHQVKLCETDLLDFVHRLRIIKTTTFRKCALLPSSGEKEDENPICWAPWSSYSQTWRLIIPRRWTRSKRAFNTTYCTIVTNVQALIRLRLYFSVFQYFYFYFYIGDGKTKDSEPDGINHSSNIICS